MDPETSYNLECRIIAYNTQSKWFSFSKVVDADITNFKDLVDEIRDKYPPAFGDVVKLFYYSADTKSNIEVTTDQELLDMFAKHVSSKICLLSIAYYSPSVEPPAIPIWDDECVDVPSTPSMPIPLEIDRSHCHHSQTAGSSEISDQQKGVDLDNPIPENEYVGLDENEEGFYMGNGRQNDLAPAAEGAEDGNAEDGPEYDGLSDSEADSDSDSNYMEDEANGIVKDKMPPHNPEVVYDKADPPMAVGTIFPDMNALDL